MYGSELLLLSFVGNLGFNKKLEQDSDVDLLIVVQDLNNLKNKTINNYAKNCCKKIGISIYSKDEMQIVELPYHGLFYLFNIVTGNIKPIYKKSNFKLPRVSLRKLILSSKAHLPQVIFLLKRELLKNDYDYRHLKVLVKLSLMILTLTENQRIIASHELALLFQDKAKKLTNIKVNKIQGCWDTEESVLKESREFLHWYFSNIVSIKNFF